MKALTISQPFASLIASGEKWLENRRWDTNYRGWLAIHAGKGRQYVIPKRSTSPVHGQWHITQEEFDRLPTGKIVALCWMADCVELDELREALALEKPYKNLSFDQMLRIDRHEHAEGPFCFVLSRIWKLPEPIEIRGKEKLWTVPESVRQQMREQYRAAKRMAAAK